MPIRLEIIPMQFPMAIFLINKLKKNFRNPLFVMLY